MAEPMNVVCLAGGTGGAKLAAGLQDLVGERLAVIANTGDDVRVHGLLVSPDPDLITFWLAGVIDEERGFGIRDDTSVAHAQLAQLGAPGWFELTDRDLAICVYRTHFIAEGGTLTAAQTQIARSIGAVARVLPMSEDAVRTRVRTPAGWRDIQEFLILDGAKVLTDVERGAAMIEAVEVEGIAEARPTPEVLEAIAAAELIVVGPSNPVISIGPILALPDLRDALAASPAPVVAVSPFIAGRAVKGPAAAFVAGLGRPVSAAGVASLYQGVIDAMVMDDADPDPPPEGVEVLTCPTLMEDAPGRQALAKRVLELGRAMI
jgi:LPPG:FO 2-phospho-L-lactate transferase